MRSIRDNFRDSFSSSPSIELPKNVSVSKSFVLTRNNLYFCIIIFYGHCSSQLSDINDITIVRFCKYINLNNGYENISPVILLGTE